MLLIVIASVHSIYLKTILTIRFALIPKISLLINKTGYVVTDSQHKDLISKAIENSGTYEGLLERRDRSIERSFNTAMSN